MSFLSQPFFLFQHFSVLSSHLLSSCFKWSHLFRVSYFIWCVSSHLCFLCLLIRSYFFLFLTHLGLVSFLCFSSHLIILFDHFSHFVTWLKCLCFFSQLVFVSSFSIDSEYGTWCLCFPLICVSFILSHLADFLPRLASSCVIWSYLFPWFCLKACSHHLIRSYLCLYISSCVILSYVFLVSILLSFNTSNNTSSHLCLSGFISPSDFSFGLILC